MRNFKKYKAFCSDCPNEPTLHITHIINGELTEFHLCADCPLLKMFHIQKQVGINDLLKGLLGIVNSPSQEPTFVIKCSNCGMTWDEFAEKGRLGCSECYKAFEEQISILLKNIHGSDQYMGKGLTKAMPFKTSSQTGEQNQIKKIEYILNLKDELQEAIQVENYERAAKLRDMIKRLEKENKNETKG